MFKKVITYKGFWKSVAFFSIVGMIFFFVLNWALSGFESEFLNLSIRKTLALLVGGFIYGFTMTYVKYWAKLKEEEQRKR